jgi:hypothetical protein
MAAWSDVQHLDMASASSAAASIECPLDVSYVPYGGAAKESLL